MINPTKMFIKMDAANTLVSSGAREQQLDVRGSDGHRRTDFDVNGFVFIDRKFNETTSDVHRDGPSGHRHERDRRCKWCL